MHTHTHTHTHTHSRPLFWPALVDALPGLRTLVLSSALVVRLACNAHCKELSVAPQSICTLPCSWSTSKARTRTPAAVPPPLLLQVLCSGEGTLIGNPSHQAVHPWAIKPWDMVAQAMPFKVSCSGTASSCWLSLSSRGAPVGHRNMLTLIYHGS